MKKTSLLLIILACTTLSLFGQTTSNNERMKWWWEARFGMFIHWGVYAVPAGIHNGQKIGRIGEWIMNRGKIPVADYKLYAKQEGESLITSLPEKRIDPIATVIKLELRGNC